MKTTARTTRTAGTARTGALALAAAAFATFGVLAPAQTASAQPKQQHSVTSGHQGPQDCAANLSALTVQFRKAGMSGQASHIAASLTLGC